MPIATRRTALVAALAGILTLPATAEAESTGGAPALEEGQIALSAKPGAIVGRTVTFTGTVEAAPAGRTVVIERFDAATSAWAAAARGAVGGDGVFTADWRPEHIGRFRFRAVLERTSEATAATSSAELPVTVYRPAMATWFGPGFYGKRTACGVRMTRALLGVAHRRLPCGTQVALYHRGRTITVPVVDRGPFRRGVDWDLTAATAKALDFTVTGRVGAVRLRDVG